MTTGSAGAAKHILHIIDSLDPANGGTSESVRALLSFAPEGYTGEVVTLDEPDAPFLQSFPFTVHALGHGRTAFGYSPKLLQWLRENRQRFDGAAVHGLWRFVGYAAWKELGGHVPYVVFTHGMLDPYFKRAFPLKHLKKWGYWLLAEYWVLRGAFRVLFTTEEESRLAKQSFALHRWKGFVIPMGTIRPPDDTQELRAAFHAKYPEVRDKRFLLFLGRIHRKKGCDLLIQAFVKSAAQDPELHLLMAGPDPQGWSAELKKMVADADLQTRVHWPGMLAGDVKWGAFYASEAFVLPSHQENFGIAVAEALGCGRPVLLSDKVNTAPDVSADGAGLMGTDTLESTYRLLERWMGLSAEERRAMGGRARACFDRRYDMRKNAETILGLFDEAPSSRGTSGRA